ncbi:hypothetical protein [Dethiobacter alkaliphilus]|uniref:Uncharacterized protein n=1 Tax=Dethiobacter alkaliphilus AHT 1 TaxID=555088 RepID=C0GI26_DETAL|nr:hypothetical protein [Dethiobacter alkaliphilus]EEG77100.1 hypothetical protein DealDRAFT_2135 [Dethiobacter alkaliphilus AHT 1]
MNKSKRFFALLAYTIFIIFIFIQGESYGSALRQRAIAEFNMLPVMVYISLFPIFMGLLIAVPYFIHEMRKKGKWKFDWIKFIAIGIPSLYLTLFYPFYYVVPFSHYIYPIRFGLLNSQILFSLGGLVFGYLVLTSFYRVKEISDAFKSQV